MKHLTRKEIESLANALRAHPRPMRWLVKRYGSHSTKVLTQVSSTLDVAVCAGRGRELGRGGETTKVGALYFWIDSGRKTLRGDLAAYGIAEVEWQK